MHAEMILILIVVLIVSQICLVQWKKWKPYSYHLCTLIGMWIIPLGLSLKNHWWRFPCIWLVFSSITSLVTKRSLEKPIQGTTPRLVYKWFLLIYKISYFIGIFRLHHHDGHIPRIEPDIWRPALHLDGPGTDVYVLCSLLWGHLHRFRGDLR